MEIFPGKTIEDLYEATQQRKYKLKKKGYRVIEVWECEWKKELKANSKLRKLWAETFVPAAFNPRAHALRGGRVEAFKLFAEAKEGECIEHYDIVCTKNLGFGFFTHLHIFKDLVISGSPKVGIVPGWGTGSVGR
jgi:hypothetical protein